MKLGFNKLTDYTVQFEALKRSDDDVEYRAYINTGKSDHGGTGRTPAEALLHAAMHWRGHERLQQEIATAEACPKCETGKLLSQPGGGVACNTNGCGYWFCY
jgi:hypothetical protein